MVRRVANFNFENNGPREANFSFTNDPPIKAVFKIAPPTVNYELLINKPKINHVELVGDKSLEDLGIILAINNLIEEHNTSETAHEFIRNLIAQEVADREAADVVINGRIDDEIQARISADNVLQEYINAEVEARLAADQILQTNIDNEARDREIADNSLHGEITAESLQREIQDNLLSGRIDSEATARENADTNINSRIDDIDELIPAEASSSNKLTDTAYVIDLIKMNAASYRGSWATWAAVPTDPNLYPADAQGDRTPSANDYMIVTADETQDGGTWMYKYTGTWDTEGKSGWRAEYEIEKTPFTPEQQAAIDSGITSALVTQIGVNESDIEGINTTLSGFGNIVTHNVAEFATAAQGALADTAVQPEDLGDGTITFIQGDEEKGSITVNQKGDTTIYLDKGGDSLFNIDGGVASSIYIPDIQTIDCGGAQYEP